MTQTLITYLILGVIAILILISFVIGLEKMIRIIFGNYILGMFSLALLSSIDLLIATTKFIGFSKFLQDGKIIITFIVYVLLLFLIYHKSKIKLEVSSDQVIQKSLYLIFVPLTVTSIALTLELIFLGSSVLDYNALLELSKGFSPNIYLQQFISYTPYFILIHALLTILATIKLKKGFEIDI